MTGFNDGKRQRSRHRTLIGYGRVSTAEQNPAHQIEALARAGIAERDIYVGT